MLVRTTTALSQNGCVWAVFIKKRGDNAHVKNKVANITRGSRYSKIVIRSDSEPAIRCMERNVVESLCEDDF